MTDKKICFHINTIIINIYSNIFLKVPVSPPDLSVKRPNLKRSKTLGLSSIDNNSYNLEVKSPLSNGKTIAQKILFSHIPTLFVSILLSIDGGFPSFSDFKRDVVPSLV